MQWKNRIMNVRLWSSLLVLVCLQGVDAWATSPSISFVREVQDLGRAPFGRKLTVHFPFTNMGDETLVIQAVKADCDCTETYNENSEVPPRGRSEIITVLDTGPLRPGRNERQVHVRSNDPQRPDVTLTMVVEVVRE